MNLEPVLAYLFGWPFVILALGIYSITRLLSKDSLIDRQREWFYNKFPHEGFTTKIRPNPKRSTFIVTGDHYYVTEGHKLGEMLHCPWCLGFWISLGVCLSFWAWPVVTTAVLVPWALRVVPGMIESVID